MLLLSHSLQVVASLDANPATEGIYTTEKWDPIKGAVLDQVGFRQGTCLNISQGLIITPCKVLEHVLRRSALPETQQLTCRVEATVGSLYCYG